MERRFWGEETERILENCREYYVPSTQSSHLVFSHRAGPIQPAVLITVDGCRVIDFHCSAGAQNLGGDNDVLIEAFAEQAKTRIFNIEYHNAPHEIGNALAEFLSSKAPVTKPAVTFFSNSGAEANEAARKACRSYRYHRGESNERRRAIYFCNAFAGRTAGNIAGTCSNPQKQQEPFLTHCDRIDSIYLQYPMRGVSWKELKERVESINLYSVDRMLMELPSQGEGGMIPIDEDALKYLFDIAQQYGIIFVGDSIQCGIGRAGALFGVDVFPWLLCDILTLAKSLGGEFKVGATIMRKDLAWQEGEHSNTFGGDPLGCRAALAVLHKVEGLIQAGRIKAIEHIIGSYSKSFFESGVVVDFRGMGAMWGVELLEKSMGPRLVEIGERMAYTEKYGLRLLTAGQGKVVRLMPPLTITDEELHAGLKLLKKALSMLGSS